MCSPRGCCGCCCRGSTRPRSCASPSPRPAPPRWPGGSTPGSLIGCGSRTPSSAQGAVALGEDHGAGSLATAPAPCSPGCSSRPAAGLRIQTIHAFAQSLLAGFPSEAGLVPGFRPLEGREEQLLARATLAELLVARRARGRSSALIRDLQALSLRLGEGGAEAFLKACAARARRRWRRSGRAKAVEARLRHAVRPAARRRRRGDRAGMRRRPVRSRIAAARSPTPIAAGARATGLSACDAIAAWLARGGAERAATLEELAGLVLTKSGRAAQGRGRTAQGRSRLRGACGAARPIAAAGCC